MNLIDERAGVRPWLYQQRPTIVIGGVPYDGRDIRIVEQHATRGGNMTRGPGGTYPGEFRGTINWMKSNNNNQGGWGGATHFTIDGRDCAMTIHPDFMPTYGAGYGGRAGTWPVDFCSLVIENCQPTREAPYPDSTIETNLELSTEIVIEHGVYPVRIELHDQTIPPPSGFVGHEDTENGDKTGKTDPGPPFPWLEWERDLQRRVLQHAETPVKGDTMLFLRPADGGGALYRLDVGNYVATVSGDEMAVINPAGAAPDVPYVIRPVDPLTFGRIVKKYADRGQLRIW